jgi:hypothetical protein
MADMARVLIMYHFGGLYLDLDFYCHRPFHCLLRQALKHLDKVDNHFVPRMDRTGGGGGGGGHSSTQAQQRQRRHRRRLQTSGNNSTTAAATSAPVASAAPALSATGNTGIVPPHLLQQQSGDNVLIVSLEPLAHALLLRNKTRVVIQDFYMATPKHPFFYWLLQDRLTVFNASVASKSHSSSSSSSSSSSRDGTDASAATAATSTATATATATTIKREEGVLFPKGPFSYSIEIDIDRWNAVRGANSKPFGMLCSDACMYVYMYVYTCMYVCMYVCMYARMYLYVS